MPTYEYRCPEGHEFEKFFRTISGAPVSVNCPTCGAVAERQLSGGAGLLFKGSGFYLTDYGKNAHATKGPKAAPSESGKGEGGSGTGAGATGDSKGSTGSSGSSSAPASGSGQSSSGSSSPGGGSSSGGSSSGTSGGGSSSSGGSGKSSKE